MATNHWNLHVHKQYTFKYQLLGGNVEGYCLHTWFMGLPANIWKGQINLKEC